MPNEISAEVAERFRSEKQPLVVPENQDDDQTQNNNEQSKLIITSDTDGKYNVLLIGTRKDQFIKDNYQGVEVKK